MWGAHATVAGSTIQVMHVLVVLGATVALVISSWRPRALVRALQTAH
jgi:hypothetical protein